MSPLYKKVNLYRYHNACYIDAYSIWTSFDVTDIEHTTNVGKHLRNKRFCFSSYTWLAKCPFSVGCWNAFIVFNVAIFRLRNEKWDIVKQAKACFESHASLGTLRFHESCDRRTYIDLPCLFKLMIRRRLSHDNMLTRLLQQHKRMW